MGWGNHHDDHPTASELERRLDEWEKIEDEKAAEAWRLREMAEYARDRQKRGYDK